MLHPTYRDNEEIFLEDLANSWGFADKCRFVFISRFLTDNDDVTNVALANNLEKKLLEDTKKSAVAEQIQRDCLRTIFRKMEAEGCEFNGVKKIKRILPNVGCGRLFIWSGGRNISGDN